MNVSFLTSNWTRLTANEPLGRVTNLAEIDLSFRLRVFSTSADWQTVLDLGRDSEGVRLPLVYVVPHRGKYDRDGSDDSSDDSYDDSDDSSDDSSYSYSSVISYSYSYSNWGHSYGSVKQKKLDATARREAKLSERFFRLQVVFNYGPAGSWAGAPEWAGRPEMGWCTAARLPSPLARAARAASLHVACSAYHDPALRGGRCTNPLKYDGNGTVEHTIRITMLNRLVHIYTNGVWQNRATWHYLGPLPSPEDAFTLYAGSGSQPEPPTGASLWDRFNLSSAVPADAEIREIVISRPQWGQQQQGPFWRGSLRYLIAAGLSVMLLTLLLLLGACRGRLRRELSRHRLPCCQRPRNPLLLDLQVDSPHDSSCFIGTPLACSSEVEVCVHAPAARAVPSIPSLSGAERCGGGGVAPPSALEPPFGACSGPLAEVWVPHIDPSEVTCVSLMGKVSRP